MFYIDWPVKLIYFYVAVDFAARALVCEMPDIHNILNVVRDNLHIVYPTLTFSTEERHESTKNNVISVKKRRPAQNIHTAYVQFR